MEFKETEKRKQKQKRGKKELLRKWDEKSWNRNEFKNGFEQEGEK